MGWVESAQSDGPWKQAQVASSRMPVRNEVAWSEVACRKRYLFLKIAQSLSCEKMLLEITPHMNEWIFSLLFFQPNLLTVICFLRTSHQSLKGTCLSFLLKRFLLSLLVPFIIIIFRKCCLWLGWPEFQAPRGGWTLYARPISSNCRTSQSDAVENRKQSRGGGTYDSHAWRRSQVPFKL